MKKYYLLHDSDTAYDNVLLYTENAEQDADAIAAGCQRITRKMAEHLAAMERCRRIAEQDYTGYYASEIYPYGEDDADPCSPYWRVDGYLVVPV